MTATTVRTLTAREYLRVSDDRSKRGRSVDEQHIENEQAALTAGWSLGNSYQEAGAVSASGYSRKARPGWDVLMADLAGGRFAADVVMLWEPSRGSRRMTHWARFIETCADAGVLIHVTSHGRTYDPRHGRDAVSLLSDGVSSVEESSKISERVGRAMAAEARDGRPHGRCPFGYVRIYSIDAGGQRIGRQVPGPGAPTVALIFTRIKAGHSLRSIARELGAGWSPTRVRDVAMNPVYVGKRLHLTGQRGRRPMFGPGDLTDGNWPALVSEADFWSVYGTLTRAERTTARRGRAAAHLLSMMTEVPCGKCGSPLSVRYGRHGGTVPVYTCHAAGHVTIERDDLDAYVTGIVIGLLSAPDAYAVISAPDDDSADLTAARDALATARAEHDELTRMVGAGKVSAVLAAGAEPAILARVDAASKRVQTLETPAGMAGLGLAPGPDIARRWDAAPLSARRAVIRAMFASIKVLPAGRGAVLPASERTEITRS